MVKIVVFCADELEAQFDVDIDMVSAVRKYELINKYSTMSVVKHSSVNNLKRVILRMDDLSDHAEEFIANALIKLKSKNPSLYEQALASPELTINKSLLILNKHKEKLILLGIDTAELELDHVAINGNPPDWSNMAVELVEYYKTGSKPNMVFSEDLHVKPIFESDYLINLAYNDFEFKSSKSDLISQLEKTNSELIFDLELSMHDKSVFNEYLCNLEKSSARVVTSLLNVIMCRNPTNEDYAMLLLYGDVYRRQLGFQDKQSISLDLTDHMGDAIGVSISA